MEPVVATSGNRWQMPRRQKPRKQAKTIAMNCHRLRATFMVRRGSTVRVRQRASAKALHVPGFRFLSSLHLFQYARRWNRRRRTDGFASSARRVRPAGGSAVAAAGRSCLSGCACPGAAAAEATGVGRDAADAAPLAQGAGSAQVGAAATKPGPPAGRRPRASARAADRRRTPEARPARVAEHRTPAATRSRSWAGAEACGPELAGFPPPAGREHARLRLLHG
jgi:hypothetical protein